MTPASSLLAALEIGLNRYLALEPSVGDELRRVSGRVLEVHLRDLGLRLQLTPVDGRLQVLPAGAAKPDATVSASVPAFARLMALSGSQRQAMFAGGRVELSGDAGLAETIFTCLRRVDFDPEDWLAKVFGDVAGHRAGVWLKGFARWGRGALDTLGLDIAEYLRDERQDLVDRDQAADWMDAVDRLSADTDRLEARLARLDKRLKKR